jgi:hypothetical protein
LEGLGSNISDLLPGLSGFVDEIKELNGVYREFSLTDTIKNITAAAEEVETISS